MQLRQNGERSGTPPRCLREKIAQKAIHGIAPDENATGIPVIKTTGASDGTRLKMTFADLLALKREFDKMGVPMQNRILVLCSDHVNDLLETEQKFKEHYNINQTEARFAACTVSTFTSMTAPHTTR